MSKKCGNNKDLFGGNLLKIILVAIITVMMLRFVITNTSLYFRDYPDLPFSRHLNKKNLILVKGEEYKLSVFGINVRVTYSSTNFRVAGVSFNGKIRAYRTGKAIIIAKTGKKELKCLVRVIDLNKSDLVLQKGATYDLDIRGVTALASFKSSNPNVATVNAFGKVKSKGKGRCTITVKVKGRTLKCSVLVK